MDEIAAIVPEMECSRQILADVASPPGPDPLPPEVALAVLDARSIPDDGMETVQRALERWPEHAIIAVVPRFRRGLLPIFQVEGLADLAWTLRAWARGRRLHRSRGSEPRVRAPPDGAAAARGPYGILGESAAVRELRGLIVRAAASDSTALISGETGVGKERVARLLHALGRRRDRAFVALNCGSVTPTLLPDALFGHEKGAFTGATTSRAGFFEEADGGTLFLDEIGETPLDLQVMLLRALQERAIRRVGGSREFPVDVRLLAAANRPMDELIAEGRLRRDLYFRLAVIPIEVPPLRERGNDVLALAEHFREECVARCGSEHVVEFTPKAREHLLCHAWPGNVRELQNCIERAVVFAAGRLLEPADLRLLSTPPQGTAVRPVAGAAVGGTESAERTLEGTLASRVKEALREAAGNTRDAAEILGISRGRLINMMRKLGLKPDVSR